MPGKRQRDEGQERRRQFLCSPRAVYGAMGPPNEQELSGRHTAAQRAAVPVRWSVWLGQVVPMAQLHGDLGVHDAQNPLLKYRARNAEPVMLVRRNSRRLGKWEVEG